jgi:hypothetical protein
VPYAEAGRVVARRGTPAGIAFRYRRAASCTAITSFTNGDRNIADASRAEGDAITDVRDAELSSIIVAEKIVRRLAGTELDFVSVTS